MSLMFAPNIILDKSSPEKASLTLFLLVFFCGHPFKKKENFLSAGGIPIDRHRKLPTWEVIQFNLHLKYQKVLFITF